MKRFPIFLSVIAISALFNGLQAGSKDRSLLNLYKKSISIEDINNSGKSITYLGHFQFPQTVKTPTLRIYYKGRIVDVENGSFSFAAQKKFQTFTIVAALLPPPTSNTIESMHVPKGTTYARYTLTRTPAPMLEEKKCEEWHIDKTTGIDGLTIPSDALIVLVDPSLINDTTVHSWFKDSFTLKLPSFTLKKKNPEEFSDAHNRSLLSALDWDSLHKKETWETLKHKQSQIARKKIA